MAESIVMAKSMNFAVRIVGLYKYLVEEKKEFVLSKQTLRSGTSIGANIREGKYAQSRKDYISKNSIALKEAAETGYWLDLLLETQYIDKQQFESLKADCDELLKLLTSIVKTAKYNEK